MKAKIEQIDKEVADYFGPNEFQIVKDNGRGKKCDVRIIRNFKKDNFDRRAAVAAYIFFKHPEVLTIAYDREYYSRDVLLAIMFVRWGR
jgi:hypothetical protein